MALPPADGLLFLNQPFILEGYPKVWRYTVESDGIYTVRGQATFPAGDQYQISININSAPAYDSPLPGDFQTSMQFAKIFNLEAGDVVNITENMSPSPDVSNVVKATISIGNGE